MGAVRWFLVWIGMVWVVGGCGVSRSREDVARFDLHDGGAGTFAGDFTKVEFGPVVLAPEMDARVFLAGGRELVVEPRLDRGFRVLLVGALWAEGIEVVEDGGAGLASLSVEIRSQEWSEGRLRVGCGWDVFEGGLRRNAATFEVAMARGDGDGLVGAYGEVARQLAGRIARDL